MNHLLERPDGATAVYVLAHGAGAGMRHPLMDAIAAALHARAIATYRYEFEYMTAGKRRPDPAKKLIPAVRAAVIAAAAEAPDLPLIAGGKSMGGRMTSLAQSQQPLPGVRALAFLGFPLHAPKRDTTDRAEHLRDIDIPMLFVQGTRDTLARLELITGVVNDHPTARIHVVETADHGFKVLKRSGRTDEQTLDEIADAVAEFALSVS